MGRKRNLLYADAYNYYLEGFSLQDIAEKFNVTRQCVYVAFKRRGFKLREINFQPFQIYDGRKFTLRNHGYYELTTNNRNLMHRYIWEKEKGKIPNGWDIHHIDGHKGHNEIGNFECLPKAEHTKKYSPHNNQYTKGRILCNT